MHILGDLTGNEIWLQLASQDGDRKEIRLTGLTFCDWAFVQVALDELPTGKTYNFTGLKIKQIQQPLSKTGTIYIDNVLAYDKSLTSIEQETVSSFFLYYAAQSNEIVASSEEVAYMELYSLSGETLMNVRGSRLGVSGLSGGVYIVKAILKSGESLSQKVVLK